MLSSSDNALTLSQKQAPSMPDTYCFAHAVIIQGAQPSGSGPESVILDGAIVVQGQTILDVGQTTDILEKHPSIPVIDARHYIITPGLFNAHTHAAMGFFRGLGHGVHQMIERLFFPAESSLTPELIEPLSYSYLLSGLRSGVTCFVDHYYFVEGVGHALKSMGLRGVLGETTADLGSAFPSLKTWSRAQESIERWPFDIDQITPCLAPHATDTVSLKLMQKIAQYAKTSNLPIHMHLSQTSGEKTRVHKREGITPVALAQKAGLLTDKTLAVHLVSADHKDLSILKAEGSTAGLCPASQIIYEKLAPIKDFCALNLPVAVGTDCAASNDNADILSELKLICLLAKEHELTPAWQSVEHWLSSVTTQPAKCFGLDHKLGQIRKGYKADLVLLKRDVSSEPLFRVTTNLIFSLGSSYVKHVLVNGKWVLWHQNPCLKSEGDMRLAYDHAVQTIEKRLIDRHALSLRPPTVTPPVTPPGSPSGTPHG
jgi:5-methylthioadenosine/S-adenosylhomocysteine deaminase